MAGGRGASDRSRRESGIEPVQFPLHIGPIARRPLMHAWPDGRVGDTVIETAANKVVVGPKRTPTQDVEFSIDALVEIAHRVGIECIATNNVHYASPAQRRLAHHRRPPGGRRRGRRH